MADKQVAMSLSSQLILHSTDVDYWFTQEASA
jgi:hypothetical protein